MVKCEFCGKEFEKENQIKLHQMKNAECLKLQAALKVTTESDDDSANEIVRDDAQTNGLSQVAQIVEEEDAESEVSTSKPWTDEQKKFNKHTYNPQNLQYVELKNPNMRPKWSNKKKFQSHINEGWIPATWADVKNINADILGYTGKSTSSVVEMNGDILMMAPTEFVESRNKHFRKLNRQSTEDLESNVKSNVGGAYGGMNVKYG